MATLLQFIQNHLPIGLDDKFTEDNETLTAEEALNRAFNKLSFALKPSDYIETPVLFSADSFDETLLSIPSMNPQTDKFAEQIILNLGTPHAKICHMRHYATERGSHWHAMFAQLDATGNLHKIIMTDSRTLASQGITSSRDIQLNPFLNDNREKIEFIPGLQQPTRTPICWMHSLANLAALATTGKIYERRQLGNFGEELSNLIQGELPLATEPKSSSEKPIRRVSNTTFFYEPPKNLPNTTEDETPLFEDKPVSSQDKSCTSSNITGGSLLLFGAGTILAGGIILAAALPISLPLGIPLIVFGLILALAGALVLVAGCTKKDEATEETVATFNY
ncbi:hypothetical protein B6N58_12260 [Legionella micdadei]|uniref:Uncharacterized protein n=2 Tax=Legionella micdadei TaxID=451 RepID=A0A098GEP0_LEGMI|nr:phage holin family protein [Legionella micdadei]ARG98374.1 hypothetical protein B6N58_12260 [Legionella micdadei]KTD27308.1 hypothetical protein Lmic_2243 [Legionella micdadei]NSL18692.1 phage holin family protein [Legionella micdadei]CEG59951.1 protein of unknown function [Legionella micdadei]SCY60090.1 hypothetical protein SAMN02982997_02188 [Legionella micdadei]